MSGFSRRPLAVVICCLFAGTQVGCAAIDVVRGAEGGALPSGAENPLKGRKSRRREMTRKGDNPSVKIMAFYNEHTAARL